MSSTEPIPERHPILTTGFRGELITISQAEALLLDASAYFHNLNPPHKVHPVARGNIITQFGNVAVRLDHLRDFATIFDDAQPEREKPEDKTKILIGDLLYGLDQQNVDILVSHIEPGRSTNINRVMEDPRYRAIDLVVKFIEATYRQMSNDGTTES